MQTNINRQAHLKIMPKGTVCAIVCPALEDELIFGLEHDPDEINIYVVRNDDISTICHKMDQRSMKYSIVEEKDVDAVIDRESYNIVIVMNAMRLHKVPQELKEYIEDQVRSYDGKYDAISVYYGVCGNYGWDVRKMADRTMTTPVTIFTDKTDSVVDDCIGVAVGGKQEYIDLVHNYTGMLFLTPAVATNWDEHIVFDDDIEWKGFYSCREDYMRDLFKWGNYEFALKIDTGLGDREIVDSKCEEVATRMGLKLILPREEIATTELATNLYNRTKALLKL